MSSPVSYDLQGQGGGIVLTAGDVANGNFRWIQVINDVSFLSISSDNIENVNFLIGPTLVAGLGIGGNFTQIVINTGVVIAYYA